jgi:hypothetical protein
MAGYVTIIEDGKEKDFPFWIGNDPRLIVDTSQLVEIQLDGDELEYLIENFVNIPYSRKARIQNWYGDMAKFIVENWK